MSVESEPEMREGEILRCEWAETGILSMLPTAKTSAIDKDG